MYNRASYGSHMQDLYKANRDMARAAARNPTVTELERHVEAAVCWSRAAAIAFALSEYYARYLPRDRRAWISEADYANKQRVYAQRLAESSEGRPNIEVRPDGSYGEPFERPLTCRHS
jgi:hypothetical protein